MAKMSLEQKEQAKRKSKSKKAVEVPVKPVDTLDVGASRAAADATAKKKFTARVSKLDNLLKHFPKGFTPRDIQVEALRKVHAEYRNDADYVVLEAPPGTGKSHMAMTTAKAYGRTYLTTLTEQLQEQYTNLFGKTHPLKVLKGRGKYQCNRANDTCKVGKQLFTGKNKCGEHVCPYLTAKKDAFAADIMVSNYHSFLANIGQASEAEGALADAAYDMGEGHGHGESGESVPRDFMVCDEAHVIESFLMDTVGFTVNREKLQVETPDLPDEERSATPYVDWMKEVIPLVIERMKAIVDPEAKDELRNLVMKMAFAVREATEHPTEFIPERGREGFNGPLRPDWFALKPLRVAKYGPWITRHAHRLLLMSATVLDAGMLVSSLGLAPAKGAFVQMGSVFPKENRPINLYPMNMSKGARDEVWPVMADMVDKLLTFHGAEKGLLLCPSNEMLKYIRSKVSRRNSERLIEAYGEERKARYNEHVNGKSPSVLAASGYWEGADLAGDASRFQIVPSAPRPMWQGQIKARAQLEDRWYRWMTWTKFVQGYGRSIRSDTDTAITYTFDRELEFEMNRPRGSMIPPWMKEAICVKKGVGTAEQAEE